MMVGSGDLLGGVMVSSMSVSAQPSCRRSRWHTAGPGNVVISPCELITVPSAFVVKTTTLTSMPSESCLPVRVQLFPSPRLKFCGVPSTSSIAPKSLVFGGKCDDDWLGCFEQLMTKTTIKAAAVVMCSVRIKCG